jgi:hypothetical protein
LDIGLVLDTFIEVLSQLKAKHFPEGSINATNPRFKFESLENMIIDPDVKHKRCMIASIKYHFRNSGVWLREQYQIVTQNKFREVGVNGHSRFSREDISGNSFRKRRFHPS